jgi:glutamate dehydrogenase (NADP+)
MKDAETLVKNGCIAVCEGANMPTELEAAKYLISQKLVFTPAKASNAGGVATSGLEMSQNSERLSWTFEEVDQKLHGIMVNIFNASYKEACEAGNPFDLLAGANIAGFKKVAEAMIAQAI